jgi:hypothetical protein
MKYMMMIVGDEEAWDALSTEQEAAVHERIGAWWEEQARAGRIVGGHELQPSATATTVRVNGSGRPTVTDGPFAEAKEVVGGYAILEVADLEEAISLASSWPGRSDTLEIRPIVVRD